MASSHEIARNRKPTCSFSNRASKNASTLAPRIVLILAHALDQNEVKVAPDLARRLKLFEEEAEE